MSNLARAVNDFLDELRREGGQSENGQKTFTVPKIPAVDRAIEQMYYAVGRNP
jgi:hypothetical protein